MKKAIREANINSNRKLKFDKFKSDMIKIWKIVWKSTQITAKPNCTKVMLSEAEIYLT